MSKYKYELTISVQGNNHDAIVEAAEEALRRYKAGNVEGCDRNDSSIFHFEQEENLNFQPSDFYKTPLDFRKD